MSIKVTAILATNKDLLIGVKSGGLAWRCKEDMQFFKETTMGHVLIMGRKTISSLPNQFLPGRIIVGLSRSKQRPADTEHVVWESNPVDALARAKQLAKERGAQVFVAGGAEIYNLYWRHCDNFIVTNIMREPFGGAQCPDEDRQHLQETRCGHWRDVIHHGRVHSVLAHDVVVLEYIPGELEL